MQNKLYLFKSTRILTIPAKTVTTFHISIENTYEIPVTISMPTFTQEDLNKTDFQQITRQSTNFKNLNPAFV